jgi:tetratricopeptide (TPR) repeat protein
MKDSAMFVLPAPMFQSEPAQITARSVLDGAAVWRQVGPNPSPQAPSPLPIPRRRTTRDAGIAPGAPAAATAQSAPAAAPSRYAQCLAIGANDPGAGTAAARAWLAESQPGAAPNASRGAAAQCLGQLLAQQGDYTGAEAAFAESAGQVPAADVAAASALQAMAGNAALAGGHAATALEWFDKALAAAPASVPKEAFGAVQIDRARALVALDRLPEAGGALEEAHRLAPNDPEGWLLSATLTRRGKDLERAQRDIEIAASLAAHGDPLAPQIGLEAGVIALLGGREAAARKSWESVLALAPESAEATTARGYLDQLGPAPAQSATTPTPTPDQAPVPETPR